MHPDQTATTAVETAFLGGKVLKRSLPLVPLPCGPQTPALKRLLLPQGELAQFYDSDEGIRYLALIELRAGTIRGNHYHKTKEERIYVIQGEVLLVVEDVNSKARDSLKLHAGDLALMPTGIAHALKPLQPGSAIEYSEARFDPADIYRLTVI